MKTSSFDLPWIFLTTIFGLFFLTHNMFPYLGYRYEGCQTMYSSLKIDYQRKINNHFFIPQWAFTDWGFYLDIKGIQVQPQVSLDKKSLFFIDFLRETKSINLETFRLILDYLCPQQIRIKIYLTDFREQPFFEGDACKESKFRNWHLFIPIQLFPANERGELKRPSS